MEGTSNSMGTMFSKCNTVSHGKMEGTSNMTITR